MAAVMTAMISPLASGVKRPVANSRPPTSSAIPAAAAAGVPGLIPLGRHTKTGSKVVDPLRPRPITAER